MLLTSNKSLKLYAKYRSHISVKFISSSVPTTIRAMYKHTHNSLRIRVFRWKVRVVQLIMKFAAVYGNRKFITVFTRSRY
jgi:hypothetical protein